MSKLIVRNTKGAISEEEVSSADARLKDPVNGHPVVPVETVAVTMEDQIQILEGKVHSHGNLSILNKLGEYNGSLTYNGTDIESSGVGVKGDKGDKGDAGYTPVKGVDYFDGEKGDKGDKGDEGAAAVTAGATGTFLSQDGATITVENGLITLITPA